MKLIALWAEGRWLFLTRSGPPHLKLTGFGSQSGCLGARCMGPLGSWEGAKWSLNGPRMRLGGPWDTFAKLQLNTRGDSQVPALSHLLLLFPRLLWLLKKAAFSLLLKWRHPGHAGSRGPSQALK